ncbi:HAAS signaling domain-containing protein [Kitasatospora sp. NPDC057223]|uniref:HAAS signaling domain-containing protein n=1 Tax=Kitasatospora sp. NPDC057223 TaxID=3346055 RepID=UPI003629A25D
MTTSRTTLVEDYLSRLDSAGAILPADRRTELVEEIRQHITDALGEADPTSVSTVRNVLDRLGPPADIIAAEAPLHDSAPKPTAPAPVPAPVAAAAAAPAPAPARAGRRTGWVLAAVAVLILLVLAFLGFFAAGEGSSPAPAAPGISEPVPSPS